MFKNILVPATGTPGDAAVFATALHVAQAFAGHLAFVHVRVDTAAVRMSITAGGIGGGDVVQEVVDSMEASAAAQEAGCRQAVDAFCAANGIAARASPGAAPGVSAEITVQIGSQAPWVAQHGRFADLVVMGRGDAADATGTALEAALMDTGKPLLIVPAHPPASMGKAVMIAWKDTPEAARAVAFALPFIARAERVMIVAVVEEGDDDDSSGARLQRALRWHNPATTFCPLVRGGRPAIEVLHQQAQSTAADLLVMGGYSHSRLYEVVFGGFTRSTLGAAGLPVLMAH